ncbi:MAG: hypothetical protein WBE80_08900 [Methylocella sp.]
MRKAGILIFSAGMIFTGTRSAFSAPRPDQSNCGAAAAGHVSPSLLGLLQQHSDGGDGLTTAVIDILSADPSATGAIVELAKLASPDQKAAIALGILRLLNGGCGSNSESAEIIRAALRCADPVFRDLLAALQNQLYAENGHDDAGCGFSSGDDDAMYGILPPVFVSPN